MILLKLKFALLMSRCGITKSKFTRPTYSMYVATLTTLRDLSRCSAAKTGMCPTELLEMRRYIEINFKLDFPLQADAFINLMYNTFSD
jgi:hypothetical protein